MFSVPQQKDNASLAECLAAGAIEFLDRSTPIRILISVWLSLGTPLGSIDKATRVTDLDFKSSFRILTAINGQGYEPFRWQSRLAEQMRRGQMPDALDIPTGLGKTSIMAIWLLARAAGASVPRRLVYVVDRRTVVDQATTYAHNLRVSLDTDSCQHIRNLLGLTRSLPISTLRGQFADNREWLEDITIPAIIIGTVDMIGSRLLFQGYGVSKTMRPMQAALLGTDSLIVLDEAHLSQPFERTIEQLSAERYTSDLHTISLSATHPSDGNTFLLTDEERSERLVQQRLEARKSLRIEDRPNAKPEDFADAAIDLYLGCPGKRILIYRDSFDDAVKISETLKKKASELEIRILLLTGQRRGLERDALVTQLLENGFMPGMGCKSTNGAILVATSAGEVGIDLDADHMICDLVPWERMVQRLGRVNRRGEGDATIAVWDLHASPNDEEMRLRKATRGLLLRLPGDDEKQAGPGALSSINCLLEAKDASSSPPLFPPLTRAHVDAWAMTSLPNHAGRPDVEPWLRGWENDPQPQTTLVWRSHLPALCDDESCTISDSNLQAFSRQRRFDLRKNWKHAVIGLLNG